MGNSHRASEIVRLIEAHRFDLSDEKRMQGQLAEVLSAHRMPFEREKRLSVRDIPDFLVDGGIAIECKMRSARKMDVYKQLCRYAEHADVRCLVLVSNLSMGLPPDINGKPIYSAKLSRGWM